MGSFKLEINNFPVTCKRVPPFMFVHHKHKYEHIKKICGDKSPFCGATGILCFGLWLTAHGCYSQRGLIIACALSLHIMDPQSQLWPGEPRTSRMSSWRAIHSTRTHLVMQPISSFCHVWRTDAIPCICLSSFTFVSRVYNSQHVCFICFYVNPTHYFCWTDILNSIRMCQKLLSL